MSDGEILRTSVAELARDCGAELVAAPALAYFSSGHRYALMVKPGGGATE